MSRRDGLPAPKAVLFDWDNTLVNTWPTITECYRATFESLGLAPGRPALGEGAKAVGPEVKVLLEVNGPDGLPQRMPIERTMVDRKTGKPLPADLLPVPTGEPPAKPPPPMPSTLPFQFIGNR